MSSGEKKFIPGTNPKWGRELPEGFDNSLVDKNGNPYDNGWNFDERDDDHEDDDAEDGDSDEPKNGWDELTEKS